MTAVVTNLTIEAGSEWSHGWAVTYNGTAIDATWTAAAQIRAKASSGSPVLYQFPASVDGSGNVTIGVPHADSSLWAFPAGVYDLEVTNAGGTVVMRVAQGTVTVSGEVTRA